MSDPDLVVVRVTVGTWEQRTITRLRSPAAARIYAATRRAITRIINGRRYTYTLWEDPNA